MGQHHHIEYLNLELHPLTNAHSISLDRIKFRCTFTHNYDHQMHGSNAMLNSLVDLQISLAESLQLHNDKVLRILEKLTKVLVDLKTTLTELNIDYLKNQTSDIFNLVSHQNNHVVEQNSKYLNLLCQRTADPTTTMIKIEKLLSDIKQILLA